MLLSLVVYHHGVDVSTRFPQTHIHTKCTIFITFFPATMLLITVTSQQKFTNRFIQLWRTFIRHQSTINHQQSIDEVAAGTTVNHRQSAPPNRAHICPAGKCCLKFCIKTYQKSCSAKIPIPEILPRKSSHEGAFYYLDFDKIGTFISHGKNNGFWALPENDQI